MYNWTDEQQKAISLTGSPIIVSAAAGSGKTAVLVERTVRLLCDEKLGIPADTLLAVTFTNDAAAQMSLKLSQAIDEKAESEPDNLYIQRQQALLRLAEITTINSFCFGLLKDNLSETDFQGGIRIIEENESSMLTDRALERVMELEYQLRPDETEELISLFCNENDAALRRLILQLYRFLRSLPFPEVWAKNALSRLRDGSAGDEIKRSMKKLCTEKTEALRSAALRLKKQCSGLKFHEAPKAVLLDNAELILAVCADSRTASPKDIADVAGSVKLKAITARQTKAEKEAQPPEEISLYESAKETNALLKQLLSELSVFSTVSDERISEDERLVADYFERLLDLTRKLDGEVYRMKVERNAVDFSDAELMSIKLLVSCTPDGKISRTPLCEEIVRSRRYRVILIDEFQDVNNLQDVIFKAISDTENLDEIGKSVFAVGDVKQAIYRFRQANPKIFTRTRAQGKDPNSPVTELLLRKNFRSRKSVLDFCNYVFGALMSKTVGETDYTDEETLYPGAEFSGPDRPTEIIAVTDDCDEELSDLEFAAAARRIRKMLNDGVTVRDGDAERPCRPSDFCVLTRTNIPASEAKEIFASEGLKILSTEASGYLRSREISLLLNILSVTVSPMQDVPLVSVMLSPIMGFTDDDIALIRIISREDKIYKTVLKISLGEEPAEEALKKKCTDAVALIKKLAVCSSGMTLTGLIRKIYDMSDIFAVASEYEDAEQKRANLYLLLEYARGYEQSGNEGLEGFLRYIGYISKSGGDFEQALTVTESSDAVIFKTIHRSKGLEYPFVILLQTRKRFNKTDLNGALQLSAEHGVGLKFLDYSTLTKRPTAFWDYIRSCNLSELLSEELRLLYVAMTRAKEQLFIVMDFSEASIKRGSAIASEITGYKISESTASKATCAADWLMAALVKHPSFTVLRSSLNFTPYTDDGPLPEISVGAMLPSQYVGGQESADNEDCDPGLSDRLRKGYLKSIDDPLTRTEAKLTVSEIVKDDALSFFPKVPSLDEAVGEISAARKGTVTHRFMQFCNFGLAADDIDSEIKRLRDLGLFTSPEADAIDRKAVSGFFKSDIYSRLKNSPTVLREQRFIVRFDDIDVPEDLKEIYRGTEGMLQGVADCLFKEGGGYVLVDYKTDRVKTPEELKERYGMQLALYKAAFDKLLDGPVKSCYIYSFRLGTGIETEV